MVLDCNDYHYTYSGGTLDFLVVIVYRVFSTVNLIQNLLSSMKNPVLRVYLSSSLCFLTSVFYHVLQVF